MPVAGGAPDCATCEVEQNCDESGHGQWFIGADGGRGFRTDRCPRSWADADFVREVEVAYWWSDRPGGGFDAYLRRAYGRSPPALLMDAMLIYGIELAEAQIDRMERRREKPGGDVDWKERTSRMLRGELAD